MAKTGIKITNESLFKFQHFKFLDGLGNTIKGDLSEIRPDSCKIFDFDDFSKTRTIIITVNINNEDFEFKIDVVEEFDDLDFSYMEIDIIGSSKETLEVDDGLIDYNF